MDERHAGTGYLALPDAATGPGVLVLHAWWGLTPFFRDVADRLAAEGFVALAPDLHGGRTTDDPAEAAAILAEVDPNEVAHLVRSSAFTLQNLPATPEGPLGVVGFSMGASWAMWLSARSPEAVAATAIFYGAQDIDLLDAQSAYLGHFAEADEFVSDDEVVLMEGDLHLLGRDVEFHRYPDTSHWFFEADRPEAYAPGAADVAWDRTVAFLRRHLQTP
jgi:carboxymethylenebutenolidase